MHGLEGGISIALMVSAYLLGSVPFGLLVAKHFANVDVRSKGSGNIGATNVARSAGKMLGLLTLVLDVVKGAALVLVATYLFKQPLWVVASAGFLAVLGHVFSIFLRFRGGKGVATGLGVFLALSPIPTLMAVAIFLAMFVKTRVVSLGSLLGAATLVAATAVLDPRREIIALALAVTTLITVRHRGNLVRMFLRTERKL